MSESPSEKTSADQPPGSPLQNFWEHSPIVMGLLFLILTAFALGAIIIPCEVVRIQPGLPAPQTLFAAFPFSWEDTRSTEELRVKEAGKLPLCYQLSAKSGSRVRELIQTLQEALGEKKKDSFYPTEQETDAAGKEIQKAVAALDGESRREFARAARHFLPIMEKYLRNGILSRQLKEESKFGQLISIKDLSNRVTSPFLMRELPAVDEAFYKIFTEALKMVSAPGAEGKNLRSFCSSMGLLMAKHAPEGNLVLDRRAMEKGRKITRERVKPIIRSVAEGEMLVERKKPVTFRQADRYEAYRKEVQKRELKAGNIALNVVRSMLILAVTLLCLRSIHPKLLHNNRSLGLLTVLVCAGIILNKLAVIFFSILAKMAPSLPPEMLYYSLPVGMSVALISAFLGTRTALFSGIFLSIIASMHVPEPARMLIAGFLISASTAIAVKGSGNYRDFFVRAFLGSYLAALAIALLFFLHEPRLWGLIQTGLQGSRALYPLFWILLLPLFTGLITAIAGQVLLYASELLFDACTAMSLQLYSDRNHPLLMKLQMEAPGTYYHCLAVSQLAEKAAGAIGADRIMAHAIGLYHDVGKLKQPLYFTENSPGVNRHEGLDPSLSAVIILNHVKYGLEVARKYKLKKPIREAIAQHHGDSLVAFFYERAKVEAKRNGTTRVDPKLFSYEGQRPTSKEISILMLADCCEAASRSAQDLTEEGIRCLVSNIIDSKTRSGGQLENSFLSVKELSIIRESFIETLSSQKHGRIAYPKTNQEKKDEDDLFVAAGEGEVPPAKS